MSVFTPTNEQVKGHFSQYTRAEDTSDGSGTKPATEPVKPTQPEAK